MIDLTPILNAIIALLCAVAVRYLVPWVKSKTSEQNRAELLVWVDIAVQAAQQLYYQSDGETRKAYVLRFLADKGYNVNDKAVDAAIEAAVLALHQSLEGGEAE